MKLQRGCEVVPDGSGLVCRQARLGGLSMAVFYTVLFAAFPVLAWWFHGPWIFIVLGVLLAGLIVPFLLGDARARYRDTNWVLWILSDSIMINLRSYQDQSPLDSVSVVELKDDDVAQVRRHVERYTIPDSRGVSVHYKLESLDVELRDAQTSELSAAMAEIRRRRQPEHVRAGMSSRSVVTLYSVSLAAPNVIRIAWFGGQGHRVTPGLRRLLEVLASRLKSGEPTSNCRPDYRELSDAELDDQVLSLVTSGNRIDAINLLVRSGKYSTTEAKQLVDQLLDRA